MDAIRELEAELATPRGFAARVQPPAGLRMVGGTIALIGVLAALGGLVQGSVVDALSALVLFPLLGLAVAAVGLARERLAIRPLRAAYLDRGWVSVQAPTGLVEDSSGEGSFVRRDDGLTSGAREHGTPVVLVGGPATDVELVAEAAHRTREELAAMTAEQARGLARRVDGEALRRNSDAGRHLPGATGMFLTVQEGSSPFVLVIPAVDGARRGDRPRYYGVKAARRSGRPRRRSSVPG